MNAQAVLTRREAEIAELFAWGAAKKDVANSLYLSERTVENHARSIYEKVGCTKVNELSAWWFCTRFHIPFDLSPLKKITAATLLVLLLPQVAIRNEEMVRRFRPQQVRVRVYRTGRRRTESEIDFLVA